METGRERLKDEQKFYEDVDKSNHSDHSWQALIIIFTILLIVSCSATFFVMTKIRSFEMPRIFSDVASKKAAKDRTITIYQSDLQGKLSGSLGRLIPLTDKKIYIDPEGLILEGKKNSQKLVFVAEPVVKNQKIALENVRLKDGQTDQITGTFSNVIGKSMAGIINQSIPFKVSDIELKNEEMKLIVY